MTWIEINKDGTYYIPPVLYVLYPQLEVTPGPDLRSVKVVFGTALLGGTADMAIACSDQLLSFENTTYVDSGVDRHIGFNLETETLTIDVTAGADVDWFIANCQALFPFVKHLYVIFTHGYAWTVDLPAKFLDLNGDLVFPNIESFVFKTPSYYITSLDMANAAPFKTPHSFPRTGKVIINLTYFTLGLGWVRALNTIATFGRIEAGIGLLLEWNINGAVELFSGYSLGSYNLETRQGTFSLHQLHNYKEAISIQESGSLPWYKDYYHSASIAKMSEGGTLFTFTGFNTIYEYSSADRFWTLGLAENIYSHNVLEYYTDHRYYYGEDGVMTDINTLPLVQNITYVNQGYYHRETEQLVMKYLPTVATPAQTRALDDVKVVMFPTYAVTLARIQAILCDTNTVNFVNTWTLYESDGVSVGLYYNATRNSVGSYQAAILNGIGSIPCLATITTLHIYGQTDIENLTGSSTITDIWIDDIENQLPKGFAAILQFTNLVTINGVPLTGCLFYDLLKAGQITWTPTLKNQMYTWPDAYHTFVTRPNARTINGVIYELPRTVLDCTPVFNPGISAQQIACIQNLHTIATRFAGIETDLPEQLKVILGMAIEALACSNAIGFYVWWSNGTDYTADYKDYAHGRVSNFGLSQPGSLIDIPKIAFVSDGWSTISWIKNDPFNAYSVPLNDIFPKKIAYTIKTVPGEGIQPYEITYTQKNHDGSAAADQNMNLYTPYGVVPRKQYV